jgi:phospholipid/cholesterol/gamma-HCH transport system permease protein
VSSWQILRSDERLAFAGDLHLRDAASIARTLDDLTREAPEQLDFDLDRVTAMDSVVIAILVAYRGALAARSVRCEIVGGSPQVRAIVRLYRGDRPPPPVETPAHELSAIERLGGSVAEAGSHAREAIAFVGDLLAAIARVARHPRRGNWRSLPLLVERAGADGLMIVVLLNFLVGFVIAFQSTRLLEIYGANLYVADIVGISMTRELAPLMTAIIMSGRSGAAYAAELGTMRVSDEIDALRTMGFSPAAYLVLPRMLALAIVAPLLTLLADIAGVLGGLVVAATILDVTVLAYFHELQVAVVVSDVWTGLIKSVGFAITIAFVGCQQGLSARGAAAGVGRGTTATVVVSLFAIVIIDTIFTIVFRRIGS